MNKITFAFVLGIAVVGATVRDDTRTICYETRGVKP